MPPKRLDLLLLEDNPGDARLLKEYLRSTEPGSFRMEVDPSLAMGLHHLEFSHFDLILLDLFLPDGAGLESLQKIRRAQPQMPVIILTGNKDSAMALESLKNGAQDYLLKDQLDGNTLVRSIRYSLERFQLYQKLQEERQRYELVALGSNDGLWDWDLSQDKVYYSPRWKKMLGYEDAEIRDKPDEWLMRVHPEDAERMTRELKDYLARLSPAFINEHRLKHKNGQYRWVLSRGMAVFDGDNKPVRIAGSFTDITDHKQMEQSLAQHAYYDPLTQMPNRLLFSENLRRAFARFQRDPRDLFSVFFLDVDHFKQINDRFGHEGGDVLLAQFAQRLRKSLRPSDFLARVGGDEFNVLLTDLKENREAITVAERILEALKEPFDLGDRKILVTTSIGIAYARSYCSSPADIVRNADHAMYQAKQTGKAHYEIFERPKDDPKTA